jgi:glucokinase
MRTVLAVDLGGTKTATAFVREDGAIRDKRKQPAARTLGDTVRQIAEAASAERVEAVGVIVPGIYDARTGMAWAPNLWGPDEQPLRDALSRAALASTVVIESDRAGYVAGEHWMGVARGLEHVAFVAIGTGIGVGIISAGRVISGAHGIAGAAGWFALDPRWKAEYAQAGCWEFESAGPALARNAGMPSAEAVVAAARAGDAAALEIVRRAATYTGMGIANLVSLLDPEMVVLGGGLMHGASLFLDTIRENVERWAQPIAFRKTRIEMTALGEDAGLLGAARIALLG